MRSQVPEDVVEIEQRLRNVAGIVRRRGRMMLEDCGITPPQFDALVIVDRDGDLTIGELGAKMFLAYSTTTDLVDRLERTNFVHRERDLEDRRVVRVRVSPAGVQMIERVLDARRNYIKDSLCSLGDDERLQVLHVLDLLYNKMAE